MGRYSFTRKEKASPDLSSLRLLVFFGETEEVDENLHELTEVVGGGLWATMLLPGVVEELEHSPTDMIHGYFDSVSSNRMSSARRS